MSHIMSKQTDNIFAAPVNKLGDFQFDQQVAEVFPDMIKRSVPGYSNIITAIGMLTKRFAQDDSNLYDLGCSLGAATIEMRRNVSHSNCKIIAVDNSSAMIERCQLHINAFKSDTEVEVVCGDIQQIDITNASVVILNFTLQFIPLAERDALIQKIADTMLPGGVLIISEKISFPDAHVQELMTDMHHAFKAAQGYSDLEISQKRASIERVLLPETLEQHHHRLQTAGFVSSDVWFQCYNFVSMVAVK